MSVISSSQERRACDWSELLQLLDGLSDYLSRLLCRAEPSTHTHGHTHSSTSRQEDRHLRDRFKELRSHLPPLTVGEVCRLQHTGLEHVLYSCFNKGLQACVEEVQEIIQEDRQVHRKGRAGRRSVVKGGGKVKECVPLAKHSEKLSMLERNLTLAHECEEAGRVRLSYEARLTLARYYEQQGDIHIVKHMLKANVRLSQLIGEDEVRAQAARNYGVVLEGMGKYAKAARYYREFWERSGRESGGQACRLLAHIYTLMANDSKERGKTSSYISYLYQCCVVSEEGGLEEQVAECYYSISLGLLELSPARPEACVSIIHKYQHYCEQHGLQGRRKEVAQVLLKSYAMLHEYDLAHTHLHTYRHICEAEGDGVGVENCEIALGYLLYVQGKPQQALDYMQQVHGARLQAAATYTRGCGKEYVMRAWPLIGIIQGQGEERWRKYLRLVKLADGNADHMIKLCEFKATGREEMLEEI